MILSSYKVNGQFNDYINDNHYYITSTELGYSYVRINNLLRYKYPVGKLFIYFNGGISNGIAITETNYKKIESKFHTTERIIEERALNEIRKHEQGWIIGTGAKYNKYSFEVRYEIGNGMSEYTALNSTTKRFYFLFGYIF